MKHEILLNHVIGWVGGGDDRVILQTLFNETISRVAHNQYPGPFSLQVSDINLTSNLTLLNQMEPIISSTRYLLMTHGPVLPVLRSPVWRSVGGHQSITDRSGVTLGIIQ